MRKISKRIVAVGLSFALVVTLPVGGLTDKTAMAASKPKLSQKKLTLKVGQKKKLKVKNTKKKIKWSSSKKKIATVSKKGVVKAKKAGKAVITAKVGGKKLKCIVKVKAKAKKPLPTKKKTGSATSTPNKPSASVQPEPTNAPEDTGKPGTTKAPEKTSEPGTTKAPENTGGPGTTKAPEPSGQPQQTPGPKLALEASNGSGTYASAFTLSLTSEPGAKIYYTTDGSNPVTSTTKKLYADGISITDRKNDKNVLSAVPEWKLQTMHDGSDLLTPSDSAVDKCTVVRAVAVGEDGAQSDIMTNTYFIGNMSQHISGIQDSVHASGENLAVISITMEQSDLFDVDKGIYAIGNNRETPNFKKKGREWERNCHIDYFESNGTETLLKLEQDCGIRIQGNYSRENIQKSFRLYAREEYGVKNFKYPFFSGLTNAKGEQMKKFKTLVLRNGGNDSFNFKYKDNMMQSFLHEQDCETLHGRPCVVYLDGEYWGHYVLQDDVSDNFLQEKRGVVKENVVVYKGSDDPKYMDYGYKLDEGELPDGVTDESYYLQETLQFLNSHDLSTDADYSEFMSKYMSEDSAVDYFATMLYLHNRYDWPGKNWSIWRTTDDTRDSCSYEDGRWRFCIYDMDLTTNTTWNTGGNLEGVDSDEVYSLADDSGRNIPQKLYFQMMKNTSFRTKLAAKVKKLATEVFTDTQVTSRGAEYLGMYRPLHEQFRKRFLVHNYDDGFAYSNHSDNISWLKERRSYVDTLVENINNFTNGASSGRPSFGNPETTLPLQNNTLIWQGKWSRTDSKSNVTTAKTEGFSLSSSDGNFMELTIDQSIWKNYKKPMLQLTVAEGAAANARCHVWGNGKNDMNKYYYLQSGDEVFPWTTQAIDISGIASNVICVNANDAQLVEVRVFEGN